MSKPLAIAGAGISLYGVWRAVRPWWRRRKRRQKFRRELDELIEKAGGVLYVMPETRRLAP